MKKLSAYIHIPFCANKCGYCDFVSFSGKMGLADAYVASLTAEISLCEHLEGATLESIFFGGGTPTTLPAETIAKIIKALDNTARITPNTEISIEANPGGGLNNPERSLTEGYFKILKSSGFNRLSIGLQAVQKRILRTLGRLHSYEDFTNTLEAARNAGFSNINADLMFSLPGQSKGDMEESLDRVLALGIVHISAYSLIIEEETPFHTLFEAGRLDLPDEETDRAMYNGIVDTLKKAGYQHYEISNFAQPGHTCRHNIATWTRQNYLGFGIGAHSMLDNTRWHNTEDIEAYIAAKGRHKHILSEKWQLSTLEQMQEFAFIGLRLLCGIDPKAFSKQFSTSIHTQFGPQIKRNTELGLLETHNGLIRLTSKGIDLSNRVLASFL